MTKARKLVTCFVISFVALTASYAARGAGTQAPAANASPNVLDEVVTALDAGAIVIPSGSRTFARLALCGCASAA